MQNVAAAACLAIAALSAPLSALAQTATIGASKDNTLYQSDLTVLSNGAGTHFFSGTTTVGEPRRGLLAFDIASAVPAGSTITGVTLTLNVSMVAPQSPSVDYALHRLTADWGEGASNAGEPGGGGTSPEPGDATWQHRFYDNILWTTPGGDFMGAPSAVATIGAVGAYSWSSPAMVADVQSWLDAPAGSFGWIVIGDEVGTRNARRFDSREHLNPAVRPTLTVQYIPAPGAATLALLSAGFLARRRR